MSLFKRTHFGFLVTLLISFVFVSGQQSPNPDGHGPAVLYLPLGGGGANQCLPAAGAKLIHLVPLMYVVIL